MNDDLRLMHAGIVCSSQENSDRFFVELLGLDKISRKILPAELSRGIFGFEQDLTLLKYGGEDAVFEIMLHPKAPQWASPLAHTCLALADRDAFIAACQDAGLKVSQVPKGDAVIVFASDFDGNLYEINQL